MTASAVEGASSGRLPWVFYFMASAGAAGAGFLQLATPLIPVLAASFGVRTGTAALLTAAAQVGFVVGLLVILPRADRVGPRIAVVTTFVLATIALSLFSLVPTFALALTCALVIGIACVAPQLLTPLASALAPPGRRGAASSLVLSGILIGALLSRAISGFVGDASGWRPLFLGAAALALLFAVASFRILPSSTPSEAEVPPSGIAAHARNDAKTRDSSPSLSLWALWRSSQVLRWHSALAFLCSAANAGFWAVHAVHLHSEFGFGSSVAGLVGLVGVAGTLSAPLGGRLVDAGRFTFAFLMATALLGAAYVSNLAGATSFVVLVLGAAALSAGGSMVHAANQASVLRLPMATGQRRNSVYMVVFFTGSATGTILASASYGAWGWTGSSLTALACVGLTIVIFLAGRARTNVAR